MSTWAPKRFWDTVTVVPEGEGFGIALDARRLRTPAKAPLVVPTQALAEAIAAEWRAQGELVKPESMPVTRTANSAIDKVRPARAAVVSMLAEYGETDLICYRADGPEELVSRQAQGWDVLVSWANNRFGHALNVTSGLVPVQQDPALLAAFQAELASLDEWQIAAVHDLITLTGSLVMGLAIARGHTDAAQGWVLSRLDDEWQAEQWGRDAEADALAATKQQALLAAERFWQMRAAV